MKLVSGLDVAAPRLSRVSLSTQFSSHSAATAGCLATQRRIQIAKKSAVRADGKCVNRTRARPVRLNYLGCAQRFRRMSGWKTCQKHRSCSDQASSHYRTSFRPVCNHLYYPSCRSTTYLSASISWELTRPVLAYDSNKHGRPSVIPAAVQITRQRTCN